MAAAVLAADQISKWIILTWLPQWVVWNKGAAFSLPVPGWLVPLALAILALSVIWFWKDWRQVRLMQLVGLGLIAGGALSNLWDRLLRGAVVDFINVRIWPVFNLADAAIVIGLGLLLWYAWRPHHAGTSHGNLRRLKQSSGINIR